MRILFQWLLTIILSIVAALATAQNDAANERYFQISKSTEIYTNILNELNQYYVDPIAPGKMLKDALDAMLINLDPFTNYISDADIQSQTLHMQSNFDGLGFSLKQQTDKKIVVGNVIEGSAADKNGVKKGYILKTINGKSIEKYDVDDVHTIIRGVSSSAIDFGFEEPSSKQTKQIIIKAEQIKNISSLTYADLIGKNKDIAIVSLAQFTPRCSNEIERALDSLKALAPNATLSAVILDFRSNPGGLLDEAVKICGLFIEKGQLVVTTKGNHKEWNKSFVTEKSPWNTQIPVGILLNATSASASEVVAGTLQDYDRAVIIGEKSYGKGLVQIYKDIGYQAKLKLTTAKYYTPTGRCIQAIDYSHRTTDGKALQIADTAKQAFKTKKGRIVYDGGGITPDVWSLSSDASNYVKSVVTKGLVFEYATQYYFSHPQIATADAFTLNDNELSSFFKWTISQNIETGTESEQLMSQLKKSLGNDFNKLDVTNSLKQLEDQIQQYKKQELEKHKAYFKQVLTEEIISRYYYQKGAITNAIQHKQGSVYQLIELLENSAAYQKILNP